MNRAYPGHNKLIQGGITNESEAEKLARGTSGDAKKKDRQRKESFQHVAAFIGGVAKLRIIVGLVSLLAIVAILIDAFEAVLLPRRVAHGFRFLRFFYRHTWHAWRWLVACIPSLRRRETFLSLFGPLALLVLLCTWAIGLIVAFAFLHWSVQTPMLPGALALHLGGYLYFSGVTFFTLGYGDLTPAGDLGKLIAVVETGLGFGFLAMVISYHPVLTQAFSRREIVISLLDARGGSPPTAAQILIRSRNSRSNEALASDLAAWETWSAELLENCLSFPMLAYYRSQHDNQSWLAALTSILDTCALQICGVGQSNPHQARLTFAIARHAAVDLTLIFKITPIPPDPDRLQPAALERLQQALSAAGIDCPEGADTVAKLAVLRGMYEPFVNGLANYFLFKLPDFVPARQVADNWQTSSWMPRTPGIRELPQLEKGKRSFRIMRPSTSVNVVIFAPRDECLRVNCAKNNQTAVTCRLGLIEPTLALAV